MHAVMTSAYLFSNCRRTAIAATFFVTPNDSLKRFQAPARGTATCRQLHHGGTHPVHTHACTPPKHRRIDHPRQRARAKREMDDKYNAPHGTV